YAGIDRTDADRRSLICFRPQTPSNLRVRGPPRCLRIPAASTQFSIHLARVRLAADELPHDHHVALAARAADTQDDGSSFGTADRSDCSIETEVRNACAVNGDDLVARDEARVDGAGAGNQLLDLQRV